MNLGEKLRQLRQERELTQPQLAEAIGIEQSYLSKLETGKSLPSEDVFTRMLEVLQVGVGDFIEGLDQGIRIQLRQIPSVANHLHEQKRMASGNRKKWLSVSAILLALGASLIYAGRAQLFMSGEVYTYQSENIYAGLVDGIVNPEVTNFDFQSSTTFLGSMYIAPVEEGSRVYTLIHTESIMPWQNKAIATFGVLLTVLGFVFGIPLLRK